MRQTGFRVYMKINRAAAETVKLFEDLSVSNVDDIMNKIAGAASEIRSMNRVKLLGTAVTVKAPIGDNLMFKHAINIAQEGDVIVVDGGGCTERAICGENMVQAAKRKGIRGFLIDGMIRDLDAIEVVSDFAVFARGAQANASYKGLGPGEVNVPVSIGGMVVYPGDIILGDLDGVIAIHPKDAEEVAQAAKELQSKESAKMELILSGQADDSWVEKVLAEKGCSFIDATWQEDQ